MRIVLILPWIASGGVLRKALQVAVGAPSGWQVNIVSIFSQNDTISLGAELSTNQPLRLGFRFPEEKGVVEQALCHKIQSLAPEVVHSMHVCSDVCAVPAATTARVPLVVRSVHGITQLSHTDNYLRTEVRYDWDCWQIEQERAIDPACHLTFAVSAELARRLEGYGLSSDRMVVVHNGVDIRKFTPVRANSSRRRALKRRLGIPLDKKVLGVVGRLDPCKNPFEALHVYSRSTSLKKESVLLYLGDGPLRTALEAQATQEAPGLVFFAGEKAFPEVMRYLSLADVVMMLSRTEGLPFVLLEAMAMEIPVVATAVGGIPEVITDQVDGFLCNAGDTSAQCALEHLIDDAGSRMLVGSRARNTVRTRFDVHEKLDAEFGQFRMRL